MIKERLQLVALGIYGRYKRLAEFLQSIWRYYGNTTFRKVDLAMLFNYLCDNPYSESRRFALMQGESQVYTYGETPLATLERITKITGITPNDLVYELGCGRGRSCFWLASFIGCRVVGIEYNPHFVDKAQALVRKFDLQGIAFRCENLLHTDYSHASVIYLYGSCLDDDFLRALVAKLKVLPKGARVVTVSYPLTDYTHEPLFRLIESNDFPFTWGTATVYFQERI